MIALSIVIIVCHFGEPVECAWPRFTPEAQTPIGCLMEGQERSQEWLDDHPGWSLVRVTCEPEQARQEKS